MELLIPAGSMEGLKTAIHYGADAIYMGGEGKCQELQFGKDEGSGELCP